jgi:hypothetical protein
MASSPSSSSSKSDQYLTQLRAAVSNRTQQNGSDEFSDSEELVSLGTQRIEVKELNSSSSRGSRLILGSVKSLKKLEATDLVNTKHQNLIVPWEELGHVEMIHRQGLGAPPILIQFVNLKEKRPYFKMFLPQNSSTQKETALFCRKKQKEYVFRFSLDGDVMTKKNNPAYVGSMVSEDSGTVWHLFNKADVCIAQIRLSISSTKKEIAVVLINEYLNLLESGSLGREFSGNINSYLDPILSLKVTKSDRPVFVFANPAHASDSPIASRPRYLIEFDYPFTIFLSFSISVLAESVLKSTLH